MMGEFSDRLKFGSTAALYCRTGQNKGRYRKKELLLLLVLLLWPIWMDAALPLPSSLLMNKVLAVNRLCLFELLVVLPVPQKRSKRKTWHRLWTPLYVTQSAENHYHNPHGQQLSFFLDDLEHSYTLGWQSRFWTKSRKVRTKKNCTKSRAVGRSKNLGVRGK